MKRPIYMTSMLQELNPEKVVANIPTAEADDNFDAIEMAALIEERKDLCRYQKEVEARLQIVEQYIDYLQKIMTLKAQLKRKEEK